MQNPNVKLDHALNLAVDKAAAVPKDIWGYVRVSTVQQTEERQLLKMKELNVPPDHIFVDKISGKNFERPEWKKLFLKLEPGCLLYIDSIDRLGRNWRETVNCWTHIVHSLGADICSLTESQSFFDSRNFRRMGKIGEFVEEHILSTLSFVADLERDNRAIYQAEGIRVAKMQGKHLGRPPLPEAQQRKIRQMAEEKLYDLETVASLAHLPLQATADVKQAFLHTSDTQETIPEFCSRKELDINKVLLAISFLKAPRFSQKDIAAEVGVSVTTVHNYLAKD